MSSESKILTGILVLVVGGMIGLFVLMNGGSTPETKVTDAGKLTRSNSHTQGTGKIQLVEFGDFQCPSCAAAHPNIKQIQAENPEVSFIFRNFPIETIHPNALQAAHAAEAAGSQGKYFEMHDILYEKQKEWSTIGSPLQTFVGYAKELGLDTKKFEEDVQTSAFKSLIDTDVADATALGVNSTPTLYLDGKKLATFDYPALRDAVAAAKAAK